MKCPDCGKKAEFAREETGTGGAVTKVYSCARCAAEFVAPKSDRKPREPKECVVLGEIDEGPTNVNVFTILAGPFKDAAPTAWAIRTQGPGRYRIAWIFKGVRVNEEKKAIVTTIEGEDDGPDG